MKTFTTLSLASALLSSVSAQQQYTIDPNSVANYTRTYWCVNQQTQCPLICLQTANSATTLQNTCVAASLTYSCVCANGMSPNVSEYTQTLPYFICTEWGNQCVANCNGDNICQSNCRSQHPCGAQNPIMVNTSTISSTMMSASASGTNAPAGVTTGSQGTVYTGLLGASSTGSPSKAGAASVRVAALRAGKTFGFLGAVGVVCGALAVVL